MSSSFDPKELKILSDILALVLEEQEGQSGAALNALRARARKNGLTGGALKNLFVAIAPNPPQRTKPRPNATKVEMGAEALSARQQIVTLTHNLRQMDLELRSTRARLEAVQSELYQTLKSRAELQSKLLTQQAHRPYLNILIWCGFAVGALTGIAGTQFIHSIVDTPRIDRSLYLR